MGRLVLANDATAAHRRCYFHLVGPDGVTAITTEAGGQPQISTDGGSWTNTGIAVLSAIGNGRYYADLTQTAVLTAGTNIETRYKSASTAETPGDSFNVVAFDPNSLSLGLTLAKTTNLTGLNDIAASAVVSGGAITTSGGAVSTVTTTGTVTTVSDKTGYSLSSTQTFNVTGNVTGNLSGSVGSVTGAVGSVTGNVGGNVVGLVAGSVGSVVGINAALIDAAISSRSTYAGGAVDSVTAGVTLADGVDHGGTTATLSLKQVAVISTSGNTPAVNLLGHGSAAGLKTTGGASSGSGIQVIAGAGGNGLDITGGLFGAALNLTSTSGSCILGTMSGTGAACVEFTGTGPCVVHLGGYAASTDVIRMDTTGGNAHGILVTASGTGDALHLVGGGSGTGIAGTLAASTLASFFATNSGTTYASSVAGSVVKEIVANAGGGTMTEATIATYLLDTSTIESGVTFRHAMRAVAAASGGILIEPLDRSSTAIAAIGNPATPRIASTNSNDGATLTRTVSLSLT